MANQKKRKNLRQTGNNNKKKPPLLDYARYVGVGVQIAVMVALGAFGGNWLDNKLKTDIPYFTILITMLAIFASLYYLVKEFSRK